MPKYYLELQELLLWVEFFSALVAVLYYKSLRHSYWKWFAIYLVIVFVQELFWSQFSDYFSRDFKQDYYGIFAIPMQYIFFYWLFALRSLKNKYLFIICLLLYCSTIPLRLFFKDTNAIESISMAVGIALLALLTLMELIKQIKDDNILKFKENKMFYINIGVILFYIGTYPFYAFYKLLFYEHIEIWNIYFLYNRISVCFCLL